ncbi:MAG: hypothetical protein E6R03_12315 [Hyphomicrobiaceae bacterium]|nr:MAG: hypothetical protein E6R03_12315 [Hyphomicrobiaceae bacterium]
MADFVRTLSAGEELLINMDGRLIPVRLSILSTSKGKVRVRLSGLDRSMAAETQSMVYRPMHSLKRRRSLENNSETQTIEMHKEVSDVGIVTQGG